MPEVLLAARSHCVCVLGLYTEITCLVFDRSVGHLEKNISVGGSSYVLWTLEGRRGACFPMKFFEAETP